MRRRWVVLAAVLLVALVGAALLLRAPANPATESAEGPALGPQAVLLVPGYGGGTEPLEPMRQRFEALGLEVRVLDVGEGTGDLRRYADDVVAQARGLLREGAGSVSLVGYSAGGVIARIAALEEPPLFNRVVTLASPHNGTVWAALAGGTNCPEACQQLRPGSPLLRELPPAPSAETWLAVYSSADQVVVPAASAALPGATVLQLADLDHGQIPKDPTVLEAVSAFLTRR